MRPTSPAGQALWLTGFLPSHLQQWRCQQRYIPSRRIHQALDLLYGFGHSRADDVVAFFGYYNIIFNSYSNVSIFFWDFS